MMMESKILNEVTVLGGLEEIVTNIKIVKEGELFSFKDFINDNEIDTLSFEKYLRGDRVCYDVYYKNEIVKGIYQILLQTYNEQPLFSMLDGYGEDLKGKRIGYYSSYQNCFYDTRNYMKKPFNFEGVEVKCYGDLLKDIRNQVNQKIYNIVNDDINNLNLSKEELELLREKTITDSFLDKCKTNAKEHILESSKEHFYIEYADYEIEIEQYKRYVVYFDYIKLIKALYNKEALIIEEVDNFINDKKNKECMYYTITKNYYVNKYIEELKQDNAILKLKEIYQALRDKSKKSLNVTYKKDGKDMTFKIEGNPHISNFKEIDTWRIINNTDRKQFEQTFKNENSWRSPDIELEYIDTITYGKKVLYQK